MELHGLISLLFCHGVPYGLVIMEALYGSNYFAVFEVQLPCCQARLTGSTALARTASRVRMGIGYCALGIRRTPFTQLNGKGKVRDDRANQGWEPRSISLNDAPSNP